MNQNYTDGRDIKREDTIRFCPECEYTGRIDAYYCPDCGSAFFPSARKGSSLRPDTDRFRK